MEDLIVTPGVRVSAFGHVEQATAGAFVLWSAFPFEPHRWPFRTTGGDIPLLLDNANEALLPTELVHVEGTWTGAAITGATVSPADDASVVRRSIGVGKAGPAEVGAEKFAEISSALDHAGDAPSLGGGGTEAAIWRHVLYVTPGLIAVINEVPIQVDAFAAMTPV